MQAMSFSAWNGLGLALVIPCVQSLIADTYSSASRGRAFGLLFFTSSLGARSPHWHDNTETEHNSVRSTDLLFGVQVHACFPLSGTSMVIPQRGGYTS